MLCQSQRALLPRCISGQFNDPTVFKVYKDKTVISRVPDMSNIKPSKKQKVQRKLFSQAVACAMVISNDPDLKRCTIKS